MKIWLQCDVDLDFYELFLALRRIVELTFQTMHNLKRALWQGYLTCKRTLHELEKKFQGNSIARKFNYNENFNQQKKLRVSNNFLNP